MIASLLVRHGADDRFDAFHFAFSLPHVQPTGEFLHSGDHAHDLAHGADLLYSLQLIAAFLQLQASGSSNEEVAAALTDAMRRVMAVAQVHKRLYTSDGVQSVSVDQYLAALVEDLAHTDDPDASPLTLAAEPLELDPDRAVAIGVIVNELVLNALKYAYPAQKGPIRIGLMKCGNGSAELSVEDDGIGHDIMTLPRSTGLGRSIVGAMANRLGADVVYDQAHRGTRVVITFDCAPRPHA